MLINKSTRWEGEVIDLYTREEYVNFTQDHVWNLLGKANNPNYAKQKVHIAKLKKPNGKIT